MGLLKSLNAVFNGVYAMSQDVPGLVETSSNLASVKRDSENIITVTTSQRSAIVSARENVSQAVGDAFELGGAKVRRSGGYPGWKPNPSSEILKVASDVYRDLFGEEIRVKAIHAGLECGIIQANVSGLDCISCGPNMKNLHSPEETLHVESFGEYACAICTLVAESK